MNIIGHIISNIIMIIIMEKMMMNMHLITQTLLVKSVRKNRNVIAIWQVLNRDIIVFVISYVISITTVARMQSIEDVRM